MAAQVWFGTALVLLGAAVGLMTQAWPVLDRRRRRLRIRFRRFAKDHKLLGSYPLHIEEWPPRFLSAGGLPVPLAHYLPTDDSDRARFYSMGNGKPYSVLEAWVITTGNSLWWTDRKVALAGFAIGVVGAVLVVI